MKRSNSSDYFSSHPARAWPRLSSWPPGRATARMAEVSSKIFIERRAVRFWTGETPDLVTPQQKGKLAGGRAWIGAFSATAANGPARPVAPYHRALPALAKAGKQASGRAVRSADIIKREIAEVHGAEAWRTVSGLTKSLAS